ncbi:hypothetical protein ACFE04_010205 [Oxalis oulophora]
MSFSERSLRIGLQDLIDQDHGDVDVEPVHKTVFQRIFSRSSSSEDDIDKRAEIFISNFRRQLRYERQVSLELRNNNNDNKKNIQRKAMSFNERDVVIDQDHDVEPVQNTVFDQRIFSRSSSSSEDDIDKRADIFISNFRRQLRYERQVSLELRYFRVNSFRN